jgi:hypothetical protein
MKAIPEAALTQHVAIPKYKPDARAILCARVFHA